MILILSEEKDVSTVHIIEWLIHWEIPFFRINQEDSIYIKKIQINNNNDCDAVFVKNKKDEISLKEIKAYWYRRGAIYVDYPTFLTSIETETLKMEIENHLEREMKVCVDYIHFLLDHTPHIGTYGIRRLNKLKVLHLAANLGIIIPETLITISKLDYLNSYHKDTITKSIEEGFSYNKERLTTYTEDIEAKDIPESFFPSLFQEKIEKEADIRIFYLKGHFYTMAIRSQQNKQTATDFRKYDFSKPARNFPFQLPKEEEIKLDQLMQKLHLESGSIDMVLTKEGTYVFLEINPVGQFNMVSVPCNYYLEKEFAQSLISLT